MMVVLVTIIRLLLVLLILKCGRVLKLMLHMLIVLWLISMK